MTDLILFFILVVVSVISYQLRRILDRNDFSKEDDSVKAMTDTVRKAKGRLPKQET